ncbi:hypothetical protein BUALT_Bualt16G0011500 [Buddleja alternifolia]|uniref:Uncharacterized protein n=1 Tax=Buddleja alternifolia TaxID=168488 RepID=A0AAV6WFT9_9LAMI|nr:hypothetical protein BUALT_Bualt16G0011500 [Buddleja alternifolia]
MAIKSTLFLLAFVILATRMASYAEEMDDMESEHHHLAQELSYKDQLRAIKAPRYAPAPAPNQKRKRVTFRDPISKARKGPKPPKRGRPKIEFPPSEEVQTPPESPVNSSQPESPVRTLLKARIKPPKKSPRFPLPKIDPIYDPPVEGVQAPPQSPVGPQLKGDLNIETMDTSSQDEEDLD